MINERAIRMLEAHAAIERGHARRTQDAIHVLGEHPEGLRGERLRDHEELAQSCEDLAKVGRLVNSDERLRDALAEARDRRDNPPRPPACSECGEEAVSLFGGAWFCEPHAGVNLVPVGPDAHALLVEAVVNDTTGVGGEDCDA